MSSPDQELAGIETAASGLIQALTERLGRHGLGEIEIRRGELRVRVSAAATAPVASAVAVTAGHPQTAGHPSAAGERQAAHLSPGAQSGVHGGPEAVAHGVTSPAVGYFAYIDGLGPGIAVEKGDPLGFVDVLGVRHDVRAPRSGVVRGLVTESGEAVEYGQLLIELEAAPA